MPLLLDDFVFVREKFQSCRCASGALVGSILLSDETIAAVKRLLANNLCESTVEVSGQHVAIDSLPSVYKGHWGCVELAPLNLKKSTGIDYIDTRCDFLRRYQSEFPTSKFYIFEDRLCSNSGAPHPQWLQSYQEILDVQSLLKGVADWTDETSRPRNIIIVQGDKVEIPLAYSIDECDRSVLASHLCEFVSGHKDYEQRKQIFRGSLVKWLKGTAKQDRFAHLLHTMVDFHKELADSYSLYLEEFSFQKLRTEFEKSKAILVKQLNQVLLDIQTKIVAVPVGYLLLLTQIKVKDGVFYNLLVLTAGSIFATILHITIQNQGLVLLSAKQDIAELKKHILGSTIANNAFGAGVQDLENYARRQGRYLWAYKAFVWAMLLLNVLLYLVQSGYYSQVIDFLSCGRVG